MLQLQALDFERWLDAGFPDQEPLLGLVQPRESALQPPAREPPPALPQGGPNTAALQAGGFAYATGLRNNDEILELVRFVPAADRWICAVGDGEQVRLRPVNLVHVPHDDYM